ncbi:MAG TPA: ABC transporter permease [Dysgonomonas sp.]|nr:ABC transporter permease [Dysgonomonas sp.]
MRNLNLIIQREYLSRIKKKSFILLTLLTPILFILLFAVPVFLSGIKDSEVKRIVVIDETGKYIPHLKSSEYYLFEPVANDEGIKTKIGKEFFGILQITEDLSIYPKAVTFLSEKQAPMDLLNYLDRTFSEVVMEDKLEGLAAADGIDMNTINNIRKVVNTSNLVSVTTLRLDTSGTEKESSTAVAAGLGGTFTLLMYMFILMYGAMVMNGVVEEKSNRIVEVMISSVKPFDLMMGKIIGIGLTGLTQLFVWLVMVSGIFIVIGIFSPTNDLSGLPNILQQLGSIVSVNWIEILIYFFLFFIGGYLIYASLFAMFGAAVDSAQDTQQFVMPVTLIFIFALYAGMYSLQNPDGPLAFWCSMIPLTSPIVMMVRIPFEIPLWEKLLSLGILYITIYFVVRFAAKIYRIGILMYGKKPSIKELIKWFSYK